MVGSNNIVLCTACCCSGYNRYTQADVPARVTVHPVHRRREEGSESVSKIELCLLPVRYTLFSLARCCCRVFHVPAAVLSAVLSSSFHVPSCYVLSQRECWVCFDCRDIFPSEKILRDHGRIAGGQLQELIQI